MNSKSREQRALVSGSFVWRLFPRFVVTLFVAICVSLSPNLVAHELNCLGSCVSVKSASVKMGHPSYPGCLFFVSYVKYQCTGGVTTYWVQNFGPVNPNDPGCAGFTNDIGSGSTTNWTLATWMFNSWVPILARYFFDQDPNSGSVYCPTAFYTFSFKQASCVRIYGYVADVVFEDFTTVAQVPHYGIMNCGDYCCEIEYEICKDLFTNNVVTRGRLVQQNFVSCAQIIPPQPPDGSNFSSPTCVPLCATVVQE